MKDSKEGTKPATGVNPMAECALASFRFVRHPSSVMPVVSSVLCILLFAAPAFAINKCLDDSGNVTFSDAPCAEGSKSQSIQIKNSAGKPTLDTSSEAVMKESVRRIMADLPQDERNQFQPAILALYIAEGAVNQSKSREEIFAAVNARLHGKTAAEIFALAGAIKNDEAVQKALRGNK